MNSIRNISIVSIKVTQRSRIFDNRNDIFRVLLNYSARRSIPIFPPKKKDDEESVGVKTKELVRIKEFFDEEGVKSNFDKNHFINTVEDFKNLRKLKRFGYSEFISAALPAMKEFGVHKDLESYKALMRVFPKGAFLPSSKLASGFNPHYIQQMAAHKIMMQMEEHGVMPDKEFQDHIIDAFSKYSLVWQRVARMTYWMTKFKNANPFPFPEEMPNDPLELAIVALKRMTIYVDPQTEIYVYRTTQVDESAEDTWICFAQSDSQCKLIEDLDFEKYRVSLDGPFNVWVKEFPISYFVLYARELRPKENRDLVEEFLSAEQRNNDVSDIPLSNFGSLDLEEAIDPMRHKHQQDDGTILAIVATGTSDQQSLIISLRKLEQHNPRLSSIAVVISQEGQSSETKQQQQSVDLEKKNFQMEFDLKMHRQNKQNEQEEKTDEKNVNEKH